MARGRAGPDGTADIASERRATQPEAKVPYLASRTVSVPWRAPRSPTSARRRGRKSPNRWNRPASRAHIRCSRTSRRKGPTNPVLSRTGRCRIICPGGAPDGGDTNSGANGASRCAVAEERRVWGQLRAAAPDVAVGLLVLVPKVEDGTGESPSGDTALPARPNRQR